MKTIRDINVKSKKVLVRCDFDVPLINKGEIADDFRIQRSIPTLNYLIEKGAKIILIGHLGRPRGKVVEDLRLTPIQDKLTEYLDLSIVKTKDYFGSEVERYVDQMKEGEILLLENLRFYKGEEDNDESFAKKLASLADLYVNDAFATSHRSHASIVSLPKYLPSVAGFALEKEIKVLSKIIKNPWHPLVIIIGGKKAETKIPVIKNFLSIADKILLGGEIANSILRAKNIILNEGFLEENVLKEIESLDITNIKIHMPIDGIITLKTREENYLRVGGPGSIKKDESFFDIGPETIKVFSQIIKSAKMILWSGPLGLFEDKNFEKGTKEIIQTIIKNYSAFKVAGGGDTISALKKFNLIDKFDHISTGGGAMLEFLSGKKLPGLQALE